MFALLPEPISLNLEPSSPTHSIAAILNGLDASALERVALDVIREQRRLLERAQALYENLSTLEAEARLNQETENLRHDYRLALLMMRAHHQITSAVIDKLGRMLRLPEDETSH
jgi:TraR antiactivator